MNVLRLRLGMACLAILAGFAAARAEGAPPSEPRPYWRTNIFRRIVSDQKFLVVTWLPSEISRPRFVVPLAAGTALAFRSGYAGDPGPDLRLEGHIADHTGHGADSWAHRLTSFGNIPALGAMLGTGYLLGRATDHDRFASATSLSLEALVDAGIYAEVVKRAAARVRPSHDLEGRFLQYAAQDNGSYPSGHATIGFAVASVFARVYRGTRWVPWVSYGTATAIGLSRIALARHFPSDVIVGAAVGTSVGAAVATRAGVEPLRPRGTGSVAPVTDAAGRGLGLAYVRLW